jgi:hypothetical protein
MVWAAACITMTSAALTAQAVGGVGDDASPLPRGTTRIRVGGTWDNATRTLTDTGSAPLRSALTRASLGTNLIPQLTGAETAIRALSGNSAFALSLGPLSAQGDVRRSTAPIHIDVGLTSRIALNVVVPYVESRNGAQLLLNPQGTAANVGQNPAYGVASAGARLANGALLRGLALARSQLAAEVARCAPATATGCDAIRANPTLAQQTLSNAESFATQVRVVYGDSVVGGAALVPVTGSTTQIAILARLTALRDAFTGFGVTALSAQLAPQAATLVYGPGGISTLANDSALGTSYAVLGGTRRSGIGDIDVALSFLAINTVGREPSDWVLRPARGVRSTVRAGWRFGVAGADRTADAFDVPIGDGANAVLAASTTDVLFSPRFWITTQARLVQPLRDNVVARRPLFSDSLLLAPAAVGPAERTVGRQLALEITPRFVVNRSVGLTVGYAYWSAAASSFAFAAEGNLPATTLSESARSLQSVVFGVTFSTLNGYLRRRARFPVEATFAHVEPLAGRGLATSTDRLELRVYTGLPRR